MNTLTKNIKLKRFISKEFFKAALLPLLVVEIALVALYFAVNSYKDNQTKETLQEVSKSHLQEIVSDQGDKISEQLRAITSLAHVLQKETERFFNAPDLFPNPVPANPPVFGFASNGMYYKLNNNGGSSLFYATLVPIGSKEKKKAEQSEGLDSVYCRLYEANKNIVAVYLNTFDSMNRYYPFIEDCYKQFPPDMDIPKYNFYYLADTNHNPGHQTVWTEAYLDPAGKGWMMSCITPVYRGDFLEGVAGIDITIDRFINNLLGLKLTWNAKAFFVDSRGTIMAMPPDVESVFQLTDLHTYVYSGQVHKDTFKPEEFNLLASKLPGMAKIVSDLMKKMKGVEEITVNSIPYFLTQATVAETGWKLFVLADQNQILEPAQYLEKKAKTVGYSVVGIMILFYLLFFGYLLKNTARMSTQLAQPLVAIADASSRLAQGDYNTQLANCGVEELDILSSSFETMARELRTLYTDLEAQVEARTRQLKETQHQLIQSSKMASVGLLAGGVAHEINNPLTGVLNNVQLIRMIAKQKKDFNLEDFKKLLDAIEESAKRCTRITRSLLDFSHASKGISQTISLNEMIEKVVILIEHELKLQNIAIQRHLQPELPQIVGEPQLIQQVIFDIITNALWAIHKKSEKEGGLITVKTGYDSEVKLVRLFISDTGIGIPKENLARIFEPFFTTKPVGEGTGLGLSIVYTIVKKHNGTIEVESEAEQGSTFKVSLPARE